jgi:hypothetical protein
MVLAIPINLIELIDAHTGDWYMPASSRFI